MTNIQINGARFEAATQWPVDVVSIDFANVEGGPDTVTYSAFDPDGSNPGGSDLPGVVVNQWTDTLIDLDFDGPSTDLFVSRVTIKSVDQLDEVAFDLIPDQATIPAVTGSISTVTTPAANSRNFFGADLDGAGLKLRVFDDFTFDKTYNLDAANDPGVFVTVFNGGYVQIDDTDFNGIAITQVQVRDTANTVIDEWYASDGPVIDRICSPAANTIRFEGRGFQTTPLGAVGYVIPRLLDYGAVLNGPNMQYEFADGSPDPVYLWELLTFTDEVIEISNPRFTSDEPSGGPGDFVVTGVAFHDPTATTMYYYEPWGLSFSTPVDGSGNCAGPSAAVVTNVESGPVGVVTVHGSGFLTAADGQPDFVQLVIPSDGNFPFDNPNAAGVVGQPSVSWTDTQIVVDLAAQYGFPGSFTGPAVVDQVQVANGTYDVTYDVGDVAVFTPDEPTFDDLTQSNFDEVTITGNYLMSASEGPTNVFRLTTVEDGDLEFYLPGSVNYPAGNPVGTGLSAVTDTGFAISAPVLVGKTIMYASLRNDDLDFIVVFNPEPDLVMV